MTPDILEQVEIDSFPEWTKLVCMCEVCEYMWVGMCVVIYVGWYVCVWVYHFYNNHILH